MVEYGWEVSYFIPGPRKFSEVTRLSENIKKPWIKAAVKEVNILINNQTFLFQYPGKGDPLTPWMHVHKEKNQSDGSLNKLRLRILVRGYLRNKELVGDTW